MEVSEHSHRFRYFLNLINEQQGPLVTVLGDVMLETHVLPHFGSGLEPAEHLGIILLKVKADEGVEFLSELLHEGGLPYLSGTSENQRLSLLAPGPSPELGHDFTFYIIAPVTETNTQNFPN